MKITMIFKYKKSARFLLRPKNQRPRRALVASPSFSRVNQLTFIAQYTKKHGSVKRNTDSRVGQRERQHVHGLHEVADLSRDNKRENDPYRSQPSSMVATAMIQSLYEVEVVLPAYHEVASNQDNQNAGLHASLLSMYWITTMSSWSGVSDLRGFRRF